VCDINNLRNIFAAKYGSQTDFNGYIDKFYSYEVFHFDNREVLKSIAMETFKSVDIADSHDGEDLSHFQAELFRTGNIALDLLQTLISYGFISLRTLATKTIAKIELRKNHVLVFDARNTVPQIDAPLLVYFKILKEIVGDYDTLKAYINAIPPQGFLLQDINRYSNELAFFVHSKKSFNSARTVFNIDNQELYLDHDASGIRAKLKNLKAFSSDSTQTNRRQYDFTMEQFQFLLIHFLSLLKRVEN
jgi:hypothetical protein